MKKLFFDMDGTVADLYGRDGWLESLQKEESGLFLNLEPMFNQENFTRICQNLISQGWAIGIITWLPRNGSVEYMETVTREKYQWAMKYMPFISEFHPLPYGTPKQYANTQNAKTMVLVDDNHEVLQMWMTPTQRKGVQILVSDKIEEVIDDLLFGY
jgi:hypothetical protein